MLYKKIFIRSSLIFLTTSMISCSENISSESEPLNIYQGGEGTVFDNTSKAYSLAIRNLKTENSEDFFVGNSLFNKNWVSAPATATVRDGLGPFFNTTSCSACHFRDGRAKPIESNQETIGLLFRLSIKGENQFGGPLDEPTYGGQLSVKAIANLAPEGQVEISYTEIHDRYPDGEAYTLLEPRYSISGNYGDFAAGYLFSPRIAQGVYGLGLLEAIDQSDILKLEDENDSNKDSISGKANYVWNVEKEKTELGRFGWKANQPSLKQQVAGAFVGDMGITSSVFKNENHSLASLDTLPNGRDEDGYEINDPDLNKVVLYIQSLAVPARRNFNSDKVKSGQKLFAKVNCSLCHTPSYTTGTHELSELSQQTIFPYTDLLLHDMGDKLSDKRPDFKANGNEWRTPPLWGLGLLQTVNGHTNLLHDGRARNLEEAILWHGGEAEDSKNKFKNLNREERTNLILFLESL